MAAMHMTLWEYVVRPECIEPFMLAYGPTGTWARLLSRSPEYVRTELHRDRDDPHRFLTIDYWISETGHERFRDDFRDEYNQLDSVCASFTTRETFIGYFRGAH